MMMSDIQLLGKNAVMVLGERRIMARRNINRNTIERRKSVH